MERDDKTENGSNNDLSRRDMLKGAFAGAAAVGLAAVDPTSAAAAARQARTSPRIPTAAGRAPACSSRPTTSQRRPSAAG